MTSSFSHSSLPMTSLTINYSSFTQLVDNDQDIITNLTYEAGILSLLFQEYVNEANKLQIDIRQYVNKMNQVLRDLPDSTDNHQSTVVRLLYEMTMRNIYGAPIVRAVTEKRIRNMADFGRNKCEEISVRALVNQSEHYLLKKLPKNIDISDMARTGKKLNDTSLKVTVAICNEIIQELMRVKEQILYKLNKNF